MHSLDETYSSDDEEDLDPGYVPTTRDMFGSEWCQYKSTTGKTDEWWERVCVGDKTLQCQLDTGAYASVINVTQHQQLATKAPIKPTSRSLVSYCQHRVTPIGYVIILVRYKDIEANLKFYVIDSK